MKFRNVSPLGELHIPTLGRVIAPGEEFDADGEVAQSLGEQAEHFQIVEQPKTKDGE